MKVSDIIGHLRNADRVSIIVGAGASKSAGIPLASELVRTINSDFNHCLSGFTKADRKNYGKVMGALSPQDRKKLIQPLLQNAKINWGHIALACLIKSDRVNVERVLTFNFDQVLERAASLMGMHLPVYDFGVSPTDDISYLASPAIMHLHGQSYGLRMMNSGDETEEHKDKLEKLLADSLRNHVVLVIGYSGEADPAFKTMTKVFNSNNHLIWCGHSQDPGKHLSNLLAKKYAHYIGGCDFDITMLELAKGLDCFPPDIFVNPPRHLLEELKDVTEWPDGEADGEGIDILTSTREQLKVFEVKWKLDDAGRVQMDVLQGGEGTKKSATNLEKSKITARAWAQISKGNALLAEARTLPRKAKTDALKQAYEKYTEAIRIKPDMHEAFNNWGSALSVEAKTLSGKAQTAAYKQAYEKYTEAIRIKPDKYETLNNWGNALSDEAQTLSGKAQTDAFKQAREKLVRAKSLNGHPSFNLACLEAVTGHIDTALDELEACYEAGTLLDAAHLDADTDLDALRDNPRYKALREQVS